MMQKKTLYRSLAYAGTLPFIVSALLLALGINALPYYGDLIHGVLSYSLVIASFMAGIHWGQFLSTPKPISVNLFITSNLITIVSWLSYLMLPPRFFCLILIIVFIALLVIDKVLLRSELIDTYYYQTRIGATTVVCATLSFIGLALIHHV